MMEYKGYTGRITAVDEKQGLLHGQVSDITDVITFEGKTAEELLAAFRESVDDYLEFCEARKEGPDRPFSGKFMVRVSPDLHRKAALAARRSGLSLNALVTAAITNHLECQGTQPGRQRTTSRSPS